MLHQLYTSKEDDENINQKQLESFKPLPEQEIIELIRVQKRIGIVGVHQQALYLMAIYQNARERNLDVDLSIELDCIIYFT